MQFYIVGQLGVLGFTISAYSYLLSLGKATGVKMVTLHMSMYMAANELLFVFFSSNKLLV